MRLARRGALVLLIVGLLILVSIGGVWPRASAASGSGFASEQLFSPGNVWEPDVAVDPSSAYVYMVATGLDAKECRQCPEPSILVRVSPDRGGTWSDPIFVCGISCRSNNIAGPWQADPIIRVANDGTVFVAWLDNWNPGIAVSKSTDHGRTWSRPVNAGNSGSGWGDKPWLAISPDGRAVYIAWNHGDPYVTASHDGGITFGRPVRLTPPPNLLFYYPESGVATSGGTAYFSMSVETAKGYGSVDLVLAKTTDGGGSWTIVPVEHSQESPGCVVSPCITDEFQAQIVMDVDSAGTLMVAYTKNAANTPKTFYSRTSTDGGASWTAPTVINDHGDSGFPAITHGPVARDFRVAWQDNRNGPTAWNTYFKSTTDGGAHWSSEVKLSNLGSGAPYKASDGYVFPYGDYFGIAANAAGTNFVVWGEGTGRGSSGGCWFTHGA